MKKILCLVLIIMTFGMPAFAKKQTENEINRMNYMNIPFWEKFNDEVLIENLYSVYEKNHDLKIALHKVNEAQRLVKISFANELPQIGFDGNVNHTFNSSNEVFGDVIIPSYQETRFLFPLTMSYEVDILGKNHLKTKAQKKQYEMALQDEKAAYITLTSAFAGDYFNLIKVDELIRLQQEIINVQKGICDAVKQKYELGTATISSVLLQEKLLTYLKDDLNTLLEKQDVLKNQMNVFVSDGEFKDISRKAYEDLNVNISIPQKVDTKFLDYRPDYVKSELAIEKAGIDVRVAKRELLPSFTINGNLGFNFYNISKVDTFLANLGVLPTMDIFTGGRKIQYLKFKNDAYKIAVEKYNNAILKSMQETNDSLFALKSADIKLITAQDRTKICADEMTLMKKRNEIGTADNLNMLLQKEQFLIAKKQEVSAKTNVIISMIDLYKAMGGFDFTTNTDL